MPLMPTRRDLVQAAALGIAAAPISAGQVRAMTSDGAALLARRLLLRDPDRSSVRLSPDGRSIAWREPRDGVLNLVVAPIEELARSRQITHFKDRPVSGYFVWASNNKYIVFFDTAGDQNYRAYSVDLDTGVEKPLTPAGGVRAYLQQRSARFPSEMLFGIDARDRKLYDIVRINIATGESQPIFQNPGFRPIYTAADFTVRFGRRGLLGGAEEIQRWEPDGTWSSFVKIPADDVLTTRIDGFSADRRSVFLIDSRGRNTAALSEIDIATGESRVLAEDPEADIFLAAYDPITNRPYAAMSIAARERWHLIDPAYAFDLEHLRAAQEGGVLSIHSQSSERGRIVAYYDRSDAAGEFRLYDRNEQSLKPLFKARTDLDGLALRPMQPVVVPASDGVPLPGYLTLPADGAKNVPLVFIVHGGPYDRVFWGYSGRHQWLASRGYGVLILNFRGSTGFGKHFINIADREWGGRMQDDLTDAAAWAVAQGYADPKRIGIYGESYGGYAALTAATKTPETFACAVDLFGPSNLVTMMRNFPPYVSRSDWKRRLADPDTEQGRQWLTERSPLFQTDRIVRPMLIGHGLQDTQVTPNESEQVVQAMQKRHIPVTYVTFPDGHGLLRQENRVAFNAVMEAFLAQHLGGYAEPIGNAFSGSTIKFETGRDLIRGIG
ncbi:Dipeptidyl aminopeptidase/acylaminoacyl peptidase [Rhizobiales bacterium GAS188]|nr:Dipeptidyl aminopeptidase/acylaminoacyl peptidase [Rhizobiales bacterium GAS188]